MHGVKNVCPQTTSKRSPARKDSLAARTVSAKPPGSLSRVRSTVCAGR